MAKYCDDGAYGAYAATPTWGAAQDGDGTTTTVGTPSTASIVFTGIPSSGTINVLGVVVSPAWATDAATCANNLAAAINALTTVAVGPASFVVKSQVRNHLYARGPSTGAAANTCEIMTRQASADHAGLIAFTHTLNNVSSSATVNFAGGTGGCWGRIVNQTTYWASALAIANYGIWGATQPFCGTIAAGDLIEIRANKALTFAATTCTLLASAMGTASNPVTFRVDNNSVWADGANKIVSFTLTGNSFNFVTITPLATTFATIRGQRTTDGTRNIKLVNNNTSTGSATVVYYGAQVTYENVHVYCSTGGDCFINQGTPTLKSLFVGCKVEHPNNKLFLNGTSAYSNGVDLIGCEFSNAGASVKNTNVIQFGVNAVYGSMLESCVFTNFVVGSVLYTWASGNGCISLRNPVLGGVTVLGGTILGIIEPSFIGQDYRGACVTVTSSDGSYEFMESARGLVEWNSGRTFPTRGATLPSGAAFSIRMLPSTRSANLNYTRPLESPRFGKKNTLASGARTIKVHFCIPASMTWTSEDVAVLVCYKDAGGVPVVISTFDYAATAITSDSGATWSSQSDGTDGGVAGQVKFDDAGSLFFNKLRIEVPTPSGSDLPIGAEISVYLRCYTSVADTSKYLFVDPDFEIV